MVAEEIEIVVTAKVTEALKEFQKILPDIKKTMGQVQNEINNVNFKEIKNQSEKVRKVIKDTFNPNDVSGMEISGIENAVKSSKKLTDEQAKLKAEMDEVGRKMLDLNADSEEYAKLMNRMHKLNAQLNGNPSSSPITVPETDNKRVITGYRTDGDGQKAEVGPSENSFTLWDKLKAKISQVKPYIQEFKKEIGNIGESKQLDWLKYQISEIEEKLQNPSQFNMDTKAIVKAEADLEKLKEKKEQVESNKGNSSTFLNWTTSIQKVASGISGVLSKVNILNTKFNGLNGITVKIKNSIKQMSTGFKSGLGTVLKYAGALVGLRSIYQTLKSSASSWLSSQNAGAQKLSANIEYMKYAMGSVFAPVVETVINLVYKLMKAIQSVAYALTGVNIFAKATASSMNKTAGSASKASKSLAGIHSEISNVSSNKDSGGGGGSTAPSMDLSKVDGEMSAFSQKLYDFFKPLKESWAKYGNDLINQLKTTAGQVVGLISSVWSSFEKVIVNGTVYKTLELILALIGNIAQAFKNAWNTNGIGDRVVQNIFEVLNNILGIINQIAQSQGFQNMLNSALNILNTIVSTIDNVATAFGNAWNYNENGDTILTNIGIALENIFNSIQQITESEEFQNFLNNMFEKFGQISETLAQINWEPLVQALFNIGQNVGGIVVDILKGLVEAFKWLVEHPMVAETIVAIALAFKGVSKALDVLIPIITTFKTIMKLLHIELLPLIAVIAGIIAIVTAVILVIMNWGTIVEWIKEKLGPLGTVISEIFGMIWDVISTVLNFIWNIFSTVFNAIWNIVSPILNAIWSVVSVVFTAIWNIISPILKNVWSTIKTVLGQIETIWSTVWNTISTVVTTIWDGIWTAIKNVINAILGGIEGMANGIVKGINVVIGALNKIKIDIPDWVPSLGGKTFGFNLKTVSEVSLPRLATGTVAYEETLGIFGEYSNAKNNPEIVSPKNIMQETFRDELQNYANNSNTKTGLEKLIIQFGSTQVALEIEQLIRQARRQNGTANVTI